MFRRRKLVSVAAWQRQGTTMSIAPSGNRTVDVSRVGPVRASAVKRANEAAPTTASPGNPSPGDQISDGLGLLSNQTPARNWYVIPGDGARNSNDSDLLVRRDASFFVVKKAGVVRKCGQSAELAAEPANPHANQVARKQEQ